MTTKPCARCGIEAPLPHRIWYSWLGLVVQVSLWLVIAALCAAVVLTIATGRTP